MRSSRASGNWQTKNPPPGQNMGWPNRNGSTTPTTPMSFQTRLSFQDDSLNKSEYAPLGQVRRVGLNCAGFKL